LEEVDAIFLDSSNVFETVSIARRCRVRRSGVIAEAHEEEKQNVGQVERRLPRTAAFGTKAVK
jgi:hypothetical protein